MIARELISGERTLEKFFLFEAHGGRHKDIQFLYFSLICYLVYPRSILFKWKRGGIAVSAVCRSFLLAVQRIRYRFRTIFNVFSRRDVSKVMGPYWLYSLKARKYIYIKLLLSYIYIKIRIFIYLYKNTHVNIYLYLYKNTYVNIYVYLYKNTYIYIFIQNYYYYIFI